MKRTVIGLGAAVLVLTACSGAPASGTKPSVSDSLAASATPAGSDVDSVTWDLPLGEPGNLDWIQDVGNAPLANICESLLRQTPEGTIEPGLAASVDHPSPKVWVYNLQPDIKFSDGTALTTDDVVFSLNRAIDPAAGSFWASWGADVSSIKASGPSSVTVTLRKPDQLWNELMSTPLGMVAKESFVKDKGASYGTPNGGVMCTGPFQLQDWARGESITLERNPYYWDDALRARADTFKFVFVTDDAALTNALTNGDIDGVYGAPLSSLQTLGSTPTGTLSYGVSTEIWAMINFATTGPMADAKVRQALSLSIDREAIAANVFQGTAEPLKSVATPATWSYAKDTFAAGYEALPSVAVDLDKAKELLKEANYQGEKIVIASEGGSAIHQQMAQIVQDSAKAIGLNVEVHPIPIGSFFSLFFDPTARKGLDGMIALNYPDIPDPLQMMVVVAAPDGATNLSSFNDPDITALLDEARTIDADEERASVVVEAQQLVMQELPQISIVAPWNRLFLNNRLAGAPPAYNYNFYYYPWAALVGGSGS